MINQMIRRLLQSRVHILSLSSHPTLAQSLAKKLDCKLSSVRRESFANGEIKHLSVPVTHGETVFVVQSPHQDVNNQVMELFLAVQACKQLHDTRVVAVVPCFPYARSDKSEDINYPIAAKLLSKFLSASGVDGLITIDLHSAQTEGFFDIPVTNIQTSSLFSEHLQVLDRDVVLVAPDAGAMKKVTVISKLTGLPFALIHKERAVDGTISRMTLVGDVGGKNSVIVDDMADTCGTVLQAADLLKARGSVSIEALMTHGVLSGGALNAINDSESLSEFVVTNTLPQRTDKCPKLKVLDVSDAITLSILRILGQPD